MLLIGLATGIVFQRHVDTLAGVNSLAALIGEWMGYLCTFIALVFLVVRPPVSLSRASRPKT